ncbi:MAG: hypothetical protein ACOZCL_03845 [Bacillota bacterium]
MSKDIIKSIIGLKMQVADNFVQHMPDKVKTRLSTLQHDIMEAVNEASNEYLKKSRTVYEKKRVKSVSIE